MQQFVVPQFIDVEDKILGPITIRQFLILLVGGLAMFLGFRFGDYSFKIFSLVVFGGVSLIIAFVKINGQPFHYFVLNIVGTLRRPGLRIWGKTYAKDELEYLRKQGTAEAHEAVAPKKMPARERIRDLSLIVNTGGYYRGEQDGV